MRLSEARDGRATASVVTVVLAGTLHLIQTVTVASTVVALAAERSRWAPAPAPERSLLESGLDVVASVAMLAAHVVSLAWLLQARRAAETLAPGYRHARGPTWVWLAWVVPGAALWFPYQVVRDVHAASRQAAGLTGPEGRTRSLVTWWVCWLCFVMSSAALTWTVILLALVVPGDPLLVGMLPMLLTGVGLAAVAAGLAWVVVVREVAVAQRLARVSAMQRSRWIGRSAGTSGPGTSVR
ncbi:DUF4328 domain-containing protein [Xylanimonas oleitrophica]|nr:DUF4328 domain-containing protein [Xylanimonas oleitrophica]